MIVGRNFAKFLSVVFFFEFAAVFAAIFVYFIPGFSFSNNLIIRIIGLFICGYITLLFYSFISEDEETIDGKDQGNFLIKDGIEVKRFIPIAIVFGIFCIFVLYILFKAIMP